MTERFIIDDCGTLIDMQTRNTYDYVSDVCGLLNEQHEENMMLRGKHTRLIILLKDIVNDLKRMDTKGYAEHVEKIGNIKFLGMEDLE